MPVTWLDVAGTYVGPGSYNYNVAGYPGGAQIYVNSATGRDDRRRLNFTGFPATSTTSRSSQGPYGDPSNPMASVFGVNGALSVCTAGRGDTIIVAPGHTENLATGAAISIPAGVTILGCSYGAARPTFSFTNAATFITGGGVGIQLNNLVFDLTQVASLTKGFLINTGGFQAVLCRFIQASGTNQATDCFVLNAGGDDCIIVGCEIDATAGISARGISNPTTNTINRLTVSNSIIHGQYSGAPISLLSTASSETVIEYCSVRQEHATVKLAIAIASGNTLALSLLYNDLLSVASSSTTAANLLTDLIGAPGSEVISAQNFARGGAATYGPAIAI